MAYPPGISLAVIEAGRAFTAFGNDASMVAKVTPVFRAQGGAAMSRIIHEASGYPMVNAPDEFKAESGSVVSFNVPHVDQPGWLSPSGDAYTMWYYAVEVTAHVGSGRNAKKYVWKQNVQPIVGQDFIDLDKVYDGPVGEPVSAPTATVTSVEGQTGSVVLGPIVGTAIDQAVLEGRIPHPEVTESAPGVYEIGEGGTVYGLTPNGDLPANTIAGLEGVFSTKEEIAAAGYLTTVPDAEVASHVSTMGTTTRAAVETVAAVPAQAVRDDLTPGNGRRPVGRGELEVSAAEFGAVGDGITDDTAALNAFLDYITANKRAGFMPGANYRITAPLVIPSRSGWSLRGNGNRATAITQATDNVPVIQLGNADSFGLNHFNMSGFWLTYTNHQPAVNTGAVGILFYDMPWQFKLDDVGFKRGHYAIRVRAGIGCPWGGSFGQGNGLHFGDDLSGGFIHFGDGINAVPNNSFGRIFGEIGPASGTLFILRGYNATMDTIELIQATTDTPKLFDFRAGAQFMIGTVKVENSPLTVGKQLIEVAGNNSFIDIGTFTWNGNGLGTANLTSGTAYLFVLGSSTSADAKVRVKFLNMYLAADSTSPLYVYRAGNANSSFRVGSVRLANGWKMENLPSGTDSAHTLFVDEWVNHRIVNRGNANLTIQRGDPNINRFNVPFTFDRTIELPTDGYNLHTGMYYDLIFYGSINNGLVGIIRGGTRELIRVSTDKVALRFMWTATSPSADGWVLTSYQTLP